jgi:ABC-type transport system substrate-binding protein
VIEEGGSAVQKLFIGGIVFMLCALGSGSSGFGETIPAPRGELRIVDKDPSNWISITFNVFEHLMELDHAGQLVPRLPTSWRWLNDRTLEAILRQGVKFHNGELFDAEVVKLNWEENTRQAQPHVSGAFMNFKPGSRLEITDPQTVRFAFPEPDGAALVKTGEGRVDLVTGLSPLETLRVAESPFARVVKNRGSHMMVFGQFDMRKAGSPWRDVRLRQVVNVAINRADLIRYATKGNGVIVPALVPVEAFGYDPDLAPYPFDPVNARQLLQEGGYPSELLIILIAPQDLEVQATVVSKMLEQVGLKVELQILDAVAFNQKTVLSHLELPAEQQPWDIALGSFFDVLNFSVFWLYHRFALDGVNDWVIEQPELRQLYEEVLGIVDREQQQRLIRQMERHTRDHAYSLFLYNPIQLYPANKAMEFVPYVTTILKLAETVVTEQHWSVRPAARQR